MDHSHMDMAEHAAHISAGFDYSLAFVAGFLGSGHCLGMCGALVSGYFMNVKSDSHLPYYCYQLARIFVYTCVGFLAAALGVVLVSSGLFGKIQSMLQMFIGGVVIILAFGILGWLPFQGSVRLLPMNLLRKGFATSRSKTPVVGAMIAGLLNGLMPCPLTFAMAVKATSAPSILEGGALMLTFGMGTLPTMLFVSYAFGKMSASVRGMMLKLAAFIMIAMGCNTIYMGLMSYDPHTFMHNHFIHSIINELTSTIEFLKQMLDYFTALLENMQR